MAKKILKSDVSEKDVYGDITSSAKLMNTELDKSNKAINAQATALKKWVSVSESGQKAIDKTLIGRKEMNDLQLRAEKSDKKKLKSEKSLQKQRLDEIRIQKQREQAFDKFERTRQKGIKTAQKARAETAKEGNAFKRLTKQVDNASNRFKRLAAQHGVNSTQAKKARKTFERLDNQLVKINTHARDGRRDVGRYGKAMAGVRGSAMRLAAGLGVAVGGMALLRDSFNVVKNFEQAQADLASVLDTNVDGMKNLTAQARELGGATTFTAAQVSQLQTELAKLGFTQSQIEDMAPATLALAEATGTDLAKAATVAGATLNGFGLEAKDTNMVVDVMAKSFSTSSLDMEKFSTAMAKTAPIANALGFTLQETTAMIGTLTDSGLDASTAGTSLKNMMLEAKKKGLSWKEALDQVNNSQDKASASLELFGKLGAASGVILAENQDKVSGLTEKLIESEGAAEKMAKTQKDTLGGALKELRSKWEDFILGTNKSTGASDKLKNAVQFLVKHLDTILSVLGKVIKLFVIYKTTLAALKLRDKIKDQIAYNKSLKDGGSDAKKATSGVKAFGQALKSIGLSVVIGLVLELAVAWLKVASGAQQAAKFAKAYKKAQDAGSEKTQERVDNINKTLKDQITALKLLEAENLKLAKSEKERREISLKTQKEIEALTVAKEKGLDAEVEKFRLKKDQALIDKNAAVAERDAFLKEQGGRGELTTKGTISSALGIVDTQAIATAKLAALDNAVIQTSKTVARLSGALSVYKGELDSTTDEVIGFKIAEGENAKGLAAGNNSLKERTSLLREIRAERLKQIENEEERAVLQARESVLNTIEDKNLTNASEEEKELCAKETNKSLVLDIAAIRKKFRDKELAEEKAHQERIAAIVLEAEDSENAQIERAFGRGRKSKKTALLNDETKTKEEIDREYTEYLLKQIDTRLLNVEKGSDEEMDILLEQAELKRQLREEDAEDAKENAEELKEFLKDMGADVLSEAVKISQEKQKLIDDEISASQKLEDRLREQANNGNAVAAESLSKQEDITNEAIAAKKKEAQREQALAELGLLYDSIRQFVEGGDSLPLATAKGTTGVFGVRKIAEALFGFKKGGYTGDAGVSDVAGVVHGQEFVIDAETTNALGLKGADMGDFKGMLNNTNSIQDMVMLAQLKGAGTLQSVGDKGGDQINSLIIQQEIQKLGQIIKDKKETVISENVKDGMLMGLQTHEKEGSITNVYNKLLPKR